MVFEIKTISEYARLESLRTLSKVEILEHIYNMDGYEEVGLVPQSERVWKVGFIKNVRSPGVFEDSISNL